MHDLPQDVGFRSLLEDRYRRHDGTEKDQDQRWKNASLKDNIQICWKGLGWEECETRWTVLGHELTITELDNCLKELIRMQHKYKWVVPEKPAVLVP